MRKSEFEQIKTKVKAEDSRFLATRSPFYQTVRMLARYYARMNAVLKPCGVDVARWRVLILLSEQEAITVSEIAEESVVHISTMAKTITRMAGSWSARSIAEQNPAAMSGPQALRRSGRLKVRIATPLPVAS